MIWYTLSPCTLIVAQVRRMYACMLEKQYFFTAAAGWRTLVDGIRCVGDSSCCKLRWHALLSFMADSRPPMIGLGCDVTCFRVRCFSFFFFWFYFGSAFALYSPPGRESERGLNRCVGCLRVTSSCKISCVASALLVCRFVSVACSKLGGLRNDFHVSVDENGLRVVVYAE